MACLYIIHQSINTTVLAFRGPCDHVGTVVSAGGKLLSPRHQCVSLCGSTDAAQLSTNGRASSW